MLSTVVGAFNQEVLTTNLNLREENDLDIYEKDLSKNH